MRPLTATRSSWSPSANTINATLYDKLNFNFIRDIAPVASICACPYVMEVNPSFPAKTVPEFIAYAKANPGKINMASAGIGTPHPCGRRAVQDDGRHQHGARALSRRGAGIDRSDRRAGAGHVRPHDLSLEYIRAGKLRALAVTTATRSEVLPDVPTVGDFVPGFEASAWYGMGAPKNTPARSSTSSTGDQRGPRRSQNQGAACGPGRHVLRARPPTSASSSPKKPRSGRKVVKFAGIKPD